MVQAEDKRQTSSLPRGERGRKARGSRAARDSNAARFPAPPLQDRFGNGVHGFILQGGEERPAMERLVLRRLLRFPRGGGSLAARRARDFHQFGHRRPAPRRQVGRQHELVGGAASENQRDFVFGQPMRQ